MKKNLFTLLFILLTGSIYAQNYSLTPGEVVEGDSALVFSNFVFCYPTYKLLEVKDKPDFISFTTTGATCWEVFNPFTGLTSHKHYVFFNLHVADDAPPGKYTFEVDYEFSFNGASATIRTLTINIEICGDIGTASQPNGEIFLCKNPPNTMYTTLGATNACKYDWTIVPTEAGVFVEDSTKDSVLINWADDFVGVAQIHVAGTNGCNQIGSTSLNLEVNIGDVPLQATKPEGETEVCIGDVLRYTTSSSGATSYSWTIAPAGVGFIFFDDSSNTINVTWDNFASVDTAKLIVFGENACGQGVSSDTLRVHISSRPGRATRPEGAINVCKNSSTTYETVEISDATSYTWLLTPNEAGTILSSDSARNITINWADEFIGTARLSVIGMSNCAQGISSPQLTIEVNDAPGRAFLPFGETNACAESIEIYSTVELSNATSYNWTVLPESAGTVTSANSGNTVMVDWASEYSGGAEIQVKAINECGEGEISESLLIEVEGLTGDASIPTGPTTLNRDADNTEYAIDEIENAKVYEWGLSPEDAGAISGNTQTAVVDWGETFLGEAKIWVRGINDCAEGEVSDTLRVNIAPPLSIDNEIFGANISLYPNPNNGEFSIEIQENLIIDIQIDIYTIKGQLVYSRKGVIGKNLIDMGNHKGIFFVKVSSEDKTYSKLFSVK